MKVPTKAVWFNTSEYYFSNWKRPSGYGVWAFEAGGEIIFRCGMFGEVKKEAAKYFAALGFREVAVLS